MYVRADYEMISSLSEYLITMADEYKEIINDMMSKLDELENYWSGPDYENYRESYKSYLRDIKTTYVQLNAYGNALKKVSGFYSDIDVKFGEAMKRFGNKDDKICR